MRYIEIHNTNQLLTLNMLIIATGDSLLQSISLSSPTPLEYEYLISPFMTTDWWQGHVDEYKCEYDAIVNALHTLNLTDVEVVSLFSMLASVLELGNLTFTDVEATEGRSAVIENIHVLENISRLLSVDVSILVQLLTTRIINSRNEVFVLHLNSIDAYHAKNAFARYLYENIFNYLVYLVNYNLFPNVKNATTTKCISVLDIFGFESFENNEFEQLLINYTNEMLQHVFNQKIFQNEITLYKSEKIYVNLTLDMCPNNQGCIELIGSKVSPSIFCVLLQAGQMNKPTDEFFCESLHKTFGQPSTISSTSSINYGKIFIPIHMKDKKKHFVIKHFASEVKYTVTEKGVDSWMKKNKDDVPENSLSILVGSGNAQITKFMTDLHPDELNATKIKKAGLRKPTICDVFGSSISSLQQKLNSNQCLFIRCIKPNTSMTPLLFDIKYTLEQVRCLGLIQSCEVMKVGLSSRISFVALKNVLGPFLVEIETLYKNESEMVFVASLLFALNIPEDTYKLGTTRVFFKNGQLAIVDRILNGEFDTTELKQKMEDALVSIQYTKGRVESLRVQSSELETRILQMNDKVMSLQNLVDDVLDEVPPYFTTLKFSEEALETVMKIFSQLQFSTKDVISYGSDISSTSDYISVSNMMNEATQHLDECDVIWKDINSKHLTAESYYYSEQSQSVKDMAADLASELESYQESVAVINALVEDASLASSRCHSDEVERLSNQCEVSMGLLHDKINAILETIMRNNDIIKNILNELKVNITCMREVILYATHAEDIRKKIDAICLNARSAIDEIREKLAMNEQQQVLALQLAREREERERLERDRLEKEAIEKAAAEEVQIQSTICIVLIYRSANVYLYSGLYIYILYLLYE